MACRDCIKTRLVNGRDVTTSRVYEEITNNRDLYRGNLPVQIKLKGSKVSLVYEDECFSATLSGRGWSAGAANTLFARGIPVSDRKAARMVSQLFDKVRSELRIHA